MAYKEITPLKHQGRRAAAKKRSELANKEFFVSGSGWRDSRRRQTKDGLHNQSAATYFAKACLIRKLTFCFTKTSLTPAGRL